MAQIIFLHGASSSGKSSLAAELRKQADQPFLHLSIDHLRDSGAWVRDSYPDWTGARAVFFSGFHRALAGFADAGNDLIVEHILDTTGWHEELKTLLAPHELLFIGLRTPLATLDAREAARKDRPIGSAKADHYRIHASLHYDLEFDGHDPAASAAQILKTLQDARPRSRFFWPSDKKNPHA